ncbi:MAG TPA: 3-phosphoshikimate 1-carboxyvinyltransferase [Polyangia bacterium]
MAFPPQLEIVPLAAPVEARLTIPGSKSITNRALILAALASGRTTLTGALWSEDTEVMVDCLRRLGFAVAVAADPGEASNRTITVDGQGGTIPNAGTRTAPLELHVGNAGTAARFVAALVCLGRGSYRLTGIPRMHERPQRGLLDALVALGYEIESTDGRLPAVVHGAGPRPGRVKVSVAESSQYASALLLAAAHGGWQVDIDTGDGGASRDELPYVEMTSALVQRFPKHGGHFTIEPDASSGSYFWGARALLAGRAETASSVIEIADWPTSGFQIDADFPGRLPLPVELSRERDLGDSIMTAIVMAPFAAHPTRFTELGRLRVQECERVLALRTELAKCGARIREIGDTLEVEPGPLRGARIATYRDHRMAMCFAMLGLAVPGMVIEDPACVRKTFPNFFAKLGGTSPGGLGATLRDPATGAPLDPAGF